MAKFHVHSLSRRKYGHTVLWAVTLSVIVVVAISALANAAHNFKAALTDKPDVAVYMLLPELHIQETTTLRETDDSRDYLAQTASGAILIKLRKGPEEWYVDFTEKLHEDAILDEGTASKDALRAHQ